QRVRAIRAQRRVQAMAARAAREQEGSVRAHGILRWDPLRSSDPRSRLRRPGSTARARAGPPGSRPADSTNRRAPDGARRAVAAPTGMRLAAPWRDPRRRMAARRAFLFVNRSSRLGAEAEPPALAERLRAFGHEVEPLAELPPRELRAVLADRVRPGDLVVLGGGDGTI